MSGTSNKVGEWQHEGNTFQVQTGMTLRVRDMQEELMGEIPAYPKSSGDTNIEVEGRASVGLYFRNAGTVRVERAGVQYDLPNGCVKEIEPGKGWATVYEVSTCITFDTTGGESGSGTKIERVIRVSLV